MARTPLSPGRRIHSSRQVRPVIQNEECEPEIRSRHIAEVLPFFNGNVCVLDWSSSPVGHSVRFRLLDDNLIHPFKGLSANPKVNGAGQRIRLYVKQGDTVLYDGQSILTWRGDDSQNGQSVSLRLENNNGYHPFSDVQVEYKTGLRTRSGDTLNLWAWVVDDDETLVRPRKPFKDMSPVQQSQIKCRRDEAFQTFCADNLEYLADLSGEAIPVIHENCSPIEFAEMVVRMFCGVKSRAEFKEDNRHGFDARMKWKLMLSLYQDSTEQVSRYDLMSRSAPRRI